MKRLVVGLALAVGTLALIAAVRPSSPPPEMIAKAAPLPAPSIDSAIAAPVAFVVRAELEATAPVPALERILSPITDLAPARARRLTKGRHPPSNASVLLRHASNARIIAPVDSCYPVSARWRARTSSDSLALTRSS